jgi:hypothetical protein
MSLSRPDDATGFFIAAVKYHITDKNVQHVGLQYWLLSALCGHYLSHQQTDKKLLLILTDGKPSDVDADDAHLSIADTAKAVKELDGWHYLGWLPVPRPRVHLTRFHGV